MNKGTTTLAGVLLAVALLAGCSSSTSSAAQSTSTPTATAQNTAATSVSTQTAASSSGELVLTTSELAKYNGKDGMPAYVAVDGVIYDVTDVPEWAGGEHNGYSAGQDLTEQIKNESPHGTSVLDGLPVVGTLSN